MFTTLTSVLLLAATATARETVSFDFGWKHRTGLTEKAVWDEPPPANPDPGANPPESKVGYKDDDWQDIFLPHDALIASAPSQKACPDGCSGKSFIPRHVLWYRKTFTIPAEWKSDTFWLDFEGSFRETTVWIDGVLSGRHSCGYTPFRVRLDNITSVEAGKPTTIAIFVDPDNGDEGARDHGSGWWYEGGGLHREVNLVRASKLHVAQSGLFAYSNLTWDGSKVATGVVHAKAELANGGTSAGSACVKFTVMSSDGDVAATAMTSAPVAVAAGGTGYAEASLEVKTPLLWSSSSPNLYTINATVHDGSCSSPAIDNVQEMHGFRELRWDANDGFFLNKQHFKIRGFCDHNNFAVVGMAVPKRVNLFRAQASRAVGGNGRRTSHNPPDPAMLDIYDRIGVTVMDENRLFDNKSQYYDNMGALVKRDRNHPSVVIWSFCNEGGCEGKREAGGPRFQEIAQEYDGSRATLANMFTFNDLLSKTIEVQGFSHQNRQKAQSCHEQMPTKPIFMSECCSCNTMRDQDEGCETLHDNPHKICNQTSFNARCAESNSATNASDGVDWVVGTMVWTLFDYYGEPPVGGPEVSSTYGQYDLCGFPKAAAFWYRVQWLLTIPDNPDKTFPTRGAVEVHIVESWESPDSWPATAGQKARTIHVYTNAPSVELVANGKSQGTKKVTPMKQGPGSYAEFLNVPWAAGTITANAKDASGKVVATDERHTLGKASAIKLEIDAPSKATGTGEAVLLDGHDAALLRASVVDSAGRVMVHARNNITFKVVSGPGRVQGSHNGDVHCHEPNNAPWHTANHGLVRGVIRVTSSAARDDLDMISRVDRSHMPSDAVALNDGWMDTADIVVEASSPGFDPVQVTIPTSTDPKDSVMNVAHAGAGMPVDFMGHSQPGPDQ